MNHRSDTARYAAKIATPFAVLGLHTDGAALTGLSFLPLAEAASAPTDRIAEQAMRELERYLVDSDYRFAVPLAPPGTPFQQRVWAALSAIPRGKPCTYGDVARTIRSVPRAVGQACGANRIPIIIPCHRVVGASGLLGGFMGAQDGDPIAIKRWLLSHEGYRPGA